MTSNLSVRAGAMRHRVAIERATVTQNSYGEEILSWGVWKWRWARVQPVSSREFLEARAQGAEVSHRVEMRAVEGITPEMRLRHKGRILEIVQPARDIEEAGKKIELLCREVV